MPEEQPKFTINEVVNADAIPEGALHLTHPSYGTRKVFVDARFTTKQGYRGQKKDGEFCARPTVELSETHAVKEDFTANPERIAISLIEQVVNAYPQPLHLAALHRINNAVQKLAEKYPLPEEE